MARRTGLIAVLAIVGALALGLLASVSAAGGGKSRSANAKLISYDEVPSLSVLTARGKVKLKIRNSSTPSIEFKLSYTGLTVPATQAHIHFGQKHTAPAGNISAFLCGGGGEAACPPGDGANKATVTGTIVPTEVIGPAAQGIAAGEFAELVAAIRAGATYVNVHTATFPTGEIRGQLRSDDDD